MFLALTFQVNLCLVGGQVPEPILLVGAETLCSLHVMTI